MYIVLLLLLGFVLRLINIDKPEGLWNDEYISWFISSIPCKEGFFHEILKQCHLPLYYLYLKPFSHCSDLILRFTSILPSVISIYIMYLIGKEFSKKTGVISAGITSTLPFLIYYSQEVRFYSLLFLFSTFSLLFMTKIIKKNQGWIGYLVSSLLILSTHVLGSIYVFLSFLYLIYKTKKINKVLLFFIIFFMILITPLGLNIIKMLPSSQWWGNFSYTNILFMFSDYLSPILTNHVNAPTTFIYNQNLYFNLIMIIPTLIGILLLINGIFKS